MPINLVRHGVRVATFYDQQRLDEYLKDEVGVTDPALLARLGFQIKS